MSSMSDQSQIQVRMQQLSGTHYVNGSWVAGSGVRHDVIDPATGKPCAQYADATGAEVDQAVAHAARAQVEWWAMSALDRANALHKAAEKMIANSLRTGECLTREMGKP
ncbi:MAG: aldehyde dehydrogenase family protein, partial [Candidatus Limnocylindrus sp.]